MRALVEVHADARQQLARDDRLGDIVDAARLQALDDVLGVGQAGHEDDRHVRQRAVLLEAAAGLEAVGARHHRVHQDHVGRHLLDDRERMLAFAGDQHGHAGLLDGVGQHAQRVRRVVDHEDDISLLLTHGRCGCPQGGQVALEIEGVHERAHLSDEARIFGRFALEAGQLLLNFPHVADLAETERARRCRCAAGAGSDSGWSPARTDASSGS